MKKTIFTSILAAMVLLTACGGGTNNTAPVNTDEPEENGIVTGSENTETPERRFMDVDYSDSFSVEYLADDVKLVTDAENRKLLLVPRGQEAPNGYDDAILIYTPAERVLFCSGTQVGMLAPYDGVFQYIGGVTQEPGRWVFPEIEERLSDGRIVYVGNSREPDYELIQELNPELAFVYTGSSGQTAMIAKLEELGIPYAVDNEYLERKHTGRMEWTKFLAAFFNREDEAVAYVETQLTALAEMEAKVAGQDKPKVAWGQIYNGIVYVSGAGSYVAGEIEAAGGDYLFSDLPGTGSVQLSVEEFYDTLMEGGVFIYDSMGVPLAGFARLFELAPIFQDCPVVANRNVWQFHINYYSNINKAHEQVVELAVIFYPDLYLGYEIQHYVPLD